MAPKLCEHNIGIKIKALVFLHVSLTLAVINEYKKTETTCFLQNDIYFTTQARSRIECAAYCKNNPTIKCTRFLFRSDKTCLLHSDDVGIGPTTSVDVTLDTDLYFTTHNQCNASGYDFITHINSCIKHFYQTSVTWVEASQLCQNDGGQLVSITTLDKWLFLTNYMNCVGKFWAGLRDMEWVNGDPFNNIYGITVLWNNVPDSNNPTDPYYDCGLITFKTSPEIVDVSCTQKVRPSFICEIEIN